MALISGCQRGPGLSPSRSLFARSVNSGRQQSSSMEIRRERYHGFQRVPFGDARELFVYRDARAADIWDEKGAVPEVFNTMIHILYDEGLITAVIDERTEEMNTIIDAIRSALDDSILFVSAALPEAA